MFDWNMVYKNGEEWSMEEIRARQRGLLGKQWKGDVQKWEKGWHKPGCKLLTPSELGLKADQIQPRHPSLLKRRRRCLHPR